MRAQRVVDLLGLDLELALVGQHLPRRARMVGDRRDPLGARLEDLDRARLGVGALALRDDRADAVARDRVADEHDVAVEPRDARAAVGERVDAQVELVAARGAGRGGGSGHAVQDRRRGQPGATARATPAAPSARAGGSRPGPRSAGAAP